jgi:NitT/TauT family transport system permease protein
LARVLVVFISAVVVITVNVRAGMRTIDPAWSDMARSFGATEGQLWHKVFLRGAIPAILTGLRLGLARSVAGMVSVEMLLVALGIGRLILTYQDTYDVASLYGTILVVVAEAIVLLQLGKWVERRMARWSGDGASK